MGHPTRINVRQSRRSAWTSGFTSAMNVAKPRKSNFPRGGYGSAIIAWQRAYSTGVKSFNFNDKLNAIDLKGRRNTSVIHEGTRAWVVTAIPGGRTSRRSRPSRRRSTSRRG